LKFLNFPFDTGANLRQGLSVWVPIILNPVLAGSKFSPTVKARTVELFRVKKYLAPFFKFQLDVSWSYSNPFLLSSCLHQFTTWKGDFDTLTKLRKFSANPLANFMNSLFFYIVSLIIFKKDLFDYKF
jgi:hypothetical protein